MEDSYELGKSQRPDSNFAVKIASSCEDVSDLAQDCPLADSQLDLRRPDTLPIRNLSFVA